jgi:hypothetical protein
LKVRQYYLIFISTSFSSGELLDVLMNFRFQVIFKKEKSTWQWKDLSLNKTG